MRFRKQIWTGCFGILLGCIGMTLFNDSPRLIKASGNDRYQDYVMCTGAVSVMPKSPTDGVWLLDYRTGRMLGTLIDRTIGKIVGWAEVDLVKEFDLPKGEDVHFLMTTGNIAQGQAALYLAEVKTGKFGVYTMGPNPEGQGLIIRRHDLTSFRPEKQEPKEGGKLLPVKNP